MVLRSERERERKIETRARLSASPDVEVSSLGLHVVKRLVLQRLVELAYPRVEIPDCSVARAYHLGVFERALREVPLLVLADRTDSVILPADVDEEDILPPDFDRLHRPASTLRNVECPGDPLHREEACEE